MPTSEGVFSNLIQLASICDHEWGTHEQIAGCRDASGQFLSTAKYPSQLAEAFSDIVLSLLSTNYLDLSFEAALQNIPKKGYEDNPKASQDGGESRMKRSYTDIVPELRKRWMRHFINRHWDKRLQTHIAAQRNQPLFSDEEVETFSNRHQRVVGKLFHVTRLVGADRPTIMFACFITTLQHSKRS